VPVGVARIWGELDDGRDDLEDVIVEEQTLAAPSVLRESHR
jgi:hypothetical protein